MHCRLLALLVAMLPVVSNGLASAQTPSPPTGQSGMVTRETYERWMAQVSNAGRWGTQDERGTLNLITREKRRQAARTVSDGVSVSLSREVIPGPNLNTDVPLELRYSSYTEGADVTWSYDQTTVVVHGWAYSHIDALPHTLYREKMYNGFDKDQLKQSGTVRLGIQNMYEGLVTRGILVDVPMLRGVPFLEPGAKITVEDLERWEKTRGVRIESGDVLLIRTGRWARVHALGDWAASKAAPGPHPSIALWLKARGVAAMGGDVSNEIYPSVVPGFSNPLHQLALVSMGMPLMDNLDLESVAREAAARRRWTFLFLAAPLRIRGGSGSLINPLAVF